MAKRPAPPIAISPVSAEIGTAFTALVSQLASGFCWGLGAAAGIALFLAVYPFP